MLQENCRIKRCSPWALGTSKPLSANPWHVWSFSPAAWATVFLFHIPMRAGQLDFIKLQKRWANSSETIACAIVKIEFGETPWAHVIEMAKMYFLNMPQLFQTIWFVEIEGTIVGVLALVWSFKKWKVYVQFQGTFKQGPFVTLKSKLGALVIGR